MVVLVGIQVGRGIRDGAVVVVGVWPWVGAGVAARAGVGIVVGVKAATGTVVL